MVPQIKLRTVLLSVVRSIGYLIYLRSMVLMMSGMALFAFIERLTIFASAEGTMIFLMILPRTRSG